MTDCKHGKTHLFDNIFQKRLLFVIGKGGVGKTTISVAIALAAERVNKKVLLVELGDSDRIGNIFGKTTLSHKPEKIHTSIWGVRANPRAELESYIHMHISIKFIANRITNSKLFDHLSDATPGLKEAMTLGRIWRWEQKKNASNKPLFDLIIVDAPATGHGLSLLRVPKTLIDMIRMGPIVEQTRIVLKLLQDKQKTGVIIVTLPEELPVNEACEFFKAVKEKLEMHVILTVLNCMYPNFFSPEEVKQVNSLLDDYLKNQNPLMTTLLKSAMAEVIRYNLQQFYYEDLQKQISEPIIKIPFLFKNTLLLEEIDYLSQFNISVENVRAK